MRTIDRLRHETETETDIYFDVDYRTKSDYIPTLKQNTDGDTYLPMLTDFYSVYFSFSPCKNA